MELNEYQQNVISDLNRFLGYLERQPYMDTAFREFWAEQGATGMPAYKNNVPGVPHVCVKVPTAGGKTFIAVNAVKPVLDAFRRVNPQRPQMVVWLVPSLTILDQTYAQLSDPQHPYRQRLNVLFQGRVAVYQKQDLLTAASFSVDTVREQLSIVVMSFDSLRARNKEDRKIFQENGNLSNFLQATWQDEAYLLPEHAPDSLINVIRQLRPLVVVDESHNAESALSVEMLRNLNPDFILDLTATPRDNSNIISYVDAMRLKKQHMVKLPVIVSNQHDRNQVIESAIAMREQLERIAVQQEQAGGKYIRPIVLFQAQPRTADDNTTFEKVRETLLALQIPAEHIRIKTAQVNELKDTNLMSRDCQVRYIITINALKEGWDCPFAYILASLADKSSAVDVEQILGRVLRMPHVQQHSHDLLNLSYVFTASSKFQATLQNITNAMNRAGFSEKEFRVHDPNIDPAPPLSLQPDQTGTLPLDLTPPAPTPEQEGMPDADTGTDEIDPAKIHRPDTSSQEADQDSSGNPVVDGLIQQATQENRAYEQQVQQETNPTPPEVEKHMKRYRIQERWQAEVSGLLLPQFHTKVVTGGFFTDDEAMQRFDGDGLLKEFRLSQQETNINFEDVDPEVYQVDLEETGKDDYKISFSKVKEAQREAINRLILTYPEESQRRDLSTRLFGYIGNLYPIPDQEVKAYIRRVVDAFNSAKIADALDNDRIYARKIRQKVRDLSDRHITAQFYNRLDTDQIFLQPSFSFPASITPKVTAPDLQKSLYQHEGEIGQFELGVINAVAALDNVRWWHRNLSRGKGFCINGNLNHYPDFIIRTESGKLIVLETKGDDRDNSDSAAKLRLGKAWESLADRQQFRYMMIFQNNAIEGAEKLADALVKLGQL